MLGTISIENGRPAMRFERRLSHPPARVWRALTVDSELRHWFVQILDFDRLRLDVPPGAEIVFAPSAEHADIEVTRGRMLRCVAPELLEYTWGSEILRWELFPDGNGACVLVFTNVIEDRGDAAAIGAGWHAGLNLLEGSLDGRPMDGIDLPDLAVDYARAFS